MTVRHRRIAQGLGRVVVVLALLVPLSFVAVTRAPRAAAATITLGENGETYENLQPGSVILASGDLLPPTGGYDPDGTDPCVGDFGIYAADLYVVPHHSVVDTTVRKLSGTPSATIVSQAVGGPFADEIVGWAGSPAVPAGADYDIVIDRCADGTFDPKYDQIDGYDQPHGAFSVAPATAGFHLDLSAVKQAYQADYDSYAGFLSTMIHIDQAYKLYEQVKALYGNLTGLAEGLKKVISAQWLPTLLSKTSYELYKKGKALPKIIKDIQSCTLGLVTGPGDINSLLTYVSTCAGLKDRDPLTRFKADDMRTVALQAKHYNDLINDPADTDIAELVGLPPQSDETPDPNNPVDAAMATFSNAVSHQQANSIAMLDALQRLEGAQLAKNGPAELLQATSVEQYGNAAATYLPALDDAAGAMISAVAGTGAPIDAVETQIRAQEQAIGATGFDPDQMAGLLGVGFSAQDIDGLRASLAVETRENLATFAQQAAQLRQADLGVRQALDALNSQLDPQVQVLGNEFGVPTPTPVLAASSGTTGSPITFDASGSTTPAGSGPLSYQWDLTGTGTFTDASGVRVTHTFSHPTDLIVGVKATNAAGISAIAYAPVRVLPSSPIPTAVISPAAVETLSPGTHQVFRASSNDTAATFSWTLDGVPATTANSYDFSATLERQGAHVVRLTASHGGVESSTDIPVVVAVPVTLTSIIVTASSPTVEPGSTDAVQALGTYSDGASSDLTGQVTWTSSDSAVAKVAPGGTVTGVATGRSTLTATLGAQSGSVGITSRPASPVASMVIRIALSEANITLAPGASTALSATARFFNQSSGDISDTATWTSSTPTVATVAKGVITAVGDGTAKITVSQDGATAQTLVFVGNAHTLPSVSLKLWPDETQLPVGGRQNYSVLATDSIGNTTDVTSQATITTSDSALLSLDGRAATAVGVGTATITATLGSLTNSTTAHIKLAPIRPPSNTLYIVTAPNRVGKITLSPSGNVLQPLFAVFPGIPDGLNGTKGSIAFDHQGHLVVPGFLADHDGHTGLFVVDADSGDLLPEIYDPSWDEAGQYAMVMDPAFDAVFIDHPGAPNDTRHTNTNPIPFGTATAFDIANLSTAAITRLYPEPTHIRDIAFTPDRRLFAVASDDTVYELNPDTGQILQQSTLATCVGSEDRVTYDPVRASLFVTSNCSGLSEIKIGTPGHRILDVVASTPGFPAGGRITANGVGGIYFADGPFTSVYDIATGTFTTLEADGPGPNRWGASEAVAPVVGAGSRPQTGTPLSPQPTALTYTGPTNATVGSTVTLSATLAETSSSAALPGAVLTLGLAGNSCSAVTNLNGIARCAVEAVHPAGRVDVTAQFAGSAADEPATATAPFTLTKQPTSLQISPTSAAFLGGDAVLTATLTRVGHPLPGKAVTLAIGARQHIQTCVATTNVQGTVTCTIRGVTQPLGNVAATATFAGDASDDGSAATGTTLVQADTELSLTTPGTAVFGATITLSARLSDPNDQPVPGQPVTLTAGTAHCPVTTTATGIASCTVTVTDPAGLAASSATFDGTATLLPSRATAPYGIIRQATHTTVIIATTLVDGQPAGLRAALTDASGSPLAAESVQLGVSAAHDPATCLASTNPDGIATCPVDTTPIGSVTITARYAGNAYYTPSSAASEDTVRAPLDHLVVTPDPHEASPGQTITYTAHGIDVDGRDVGDVTVATAFHIEPDGACTHATCTAVSTGTHTVTADDHGIAGHALLAVKADQTGQTSTSASTSAGPITAPASSTLSPPTTTASSRRPTTGGGDTTTATSHPTITASDAVLTTETSPSTAAVPPPDTAAVPPADTAPSTSPRTGNLADTGPRATTGLVTAALLTLAAGLALNRAGRTRRPRHR